MNAMREVRIEKLTLNFGAGKEQAKLDKGIAMIKSITGKEPLKTVTNKRIPAWGVRPGLPIGCMLTLRKKAATELLPRLLAAKEKKLASSCFDNYGNVSFGIPEYIEIPGVKYDPKIGVIGLQVCITLGRKGYRIKERKLRNTRIGKKHIVTKNDAMDFMKQKYEVTAA